MGGKHSILDDSNWESVTPETMVGMNEYADGEMHQLIGRAPELAVEYPDRYKYLAWLHGTAASVHLASFVIIAILMGECSTDTSDKLRVYTPTREWDTRRMSFIPRFDMIHLTSVESTVANMTINSTIANTTIKSTTAPIVLNRTEILNRARAMNLTTAPIMFNGTKISNRTMELNIDTAGTMYTVEWGTFSIQGMILYVLGVSCVSSLLSMVEACCQSCSTAAAKKSSPLDAHYTVPDHKTAYIRWAEYTMTAPFMIWLISYYAGITDTYTLVTVACITALMMPMGAILLILESWRVATTDNRDDNQIDSHLRLSYVVLCTAWLLQILVWTIIVWSFVDTVNTATPPDFVYAIFILEMIMFLGFGVIQTICTVIPLEVNNAMYVEMPWPEYAYPAMSISSKTFLAWMLYGFVLREGC
jgi:hypothetical protein